jgi:hypothetical protein
MSSPQYFCSHSHGGFTFPCTLTFRHPLSLICTQVALDQEQAKDAEVKAEARRKFNESQAKMRAQVLL